MSHNVSSGSIHTLDALLPQEVRDKLQADNWADYQANIENRIEIYNDDWRLKLIYYIMSTLSAESQAYFFGNMALYEREAGKDTHYVGKNLWPIPTHINVLKRVVKETSLVYNDLAERRFVTVTQETDALGKEKDKFDESVRFNEIVEAGNYNAMMQRVNELVNLCNMVIVRPVPDKSKKSGFRFDIYTPDKFTPIQHPDDPTRLIGVIYVSDCTDTRGGLSATRKELIFYIGTGEKGDEPFFAERENTDETDISKIEKQPYKFIDPKTDKPYLPFVAFHKEYPDTGTYINRTKGDDLVEATFITAWLVSLWLRKFHDHSSKQLVVFGATAKDILPTIIRDSLQIIRFAYSKDDAQLENIDHTIDLKSLWETVLQYIESIISNEGLSLDKYKSTPESGLSVRLQNESIITLIRSQWELYRSSETELADIIRLLNNQFIIEKEGGKIDPEAIFSINFGALPFDDDPMRLTQEYKDLANANIMSLAEVLRKYNPDIGTIEDAQEQILENQRLNDEVRKGPAIGFGGEGEEIPPVPETETPVNPLEEPLIPAVDEAIEEIATEEEI